MTTYLLDVNLLLALSDPMHVHHEIAHHWFSERGHSGWATCPLTENGYIRVASHPKYPNSPGPPSVTLVILRRFCAHSNHQFWGSGTTLRHALAADAVLTHNHITDIYLLALALQNGGKLATLDRGIPVAALMHGADALEVLEP